MRIKEGEQLPESEFFYLDSYGAQKIKSINLFKNQKAIIIGVPGAFTKVCSVKHLPGFVKNFEAAKQKGVTKIVCISVNDPNVMKAWGDDRNVGEDVLMLSDGNGEFTAAIGLEMDGSGFGLGTRSKICNDY